jgi:hypothetical protein
VDAARIRAHLGNTVTAEDSGNGEDERERLCSALNSLLDEGRTSAGADSPMGHGGLSALQFRWYERRAIVEASMPGAFRGGAAVEFAGGFRTIEEIAGAISPSYAGTLDLTICQSVLLGETIRRKCGKCLVLTSAETTSMDFRFAVYHQVIEILARSSRPFEDVVIDVRKTLVLRYGKPQE